MGCTISAEAKPVQESRGEKSLEPKAKTTITTQNTCSRSLKTQQTSEVQAKKTEIITGQNTANSKTSNEAKAFEGRPTETAKVLTILHFNDVYNIEPREKEPVGGVARFAHKLTSYKDLNPLTVFSGDVLNPSLMSSVTRGKHMVPVLNSLDVNIAVYGNHDFDFGVDELIEFNEATNFPWLMSNVIDKTSNGPLADGDIKKIIEWNGRKIGFIGLVEEEWLATLATVDPSEVIFQDYATRGTELAKQLRDDGATFVIALTHMRLPNDTRLAQKSLGIDLILGGHDHHYEVKEVNGIKIIKSGSDFRHFSVITICFSDDNNFNIDVEKIEITSDIPEDPNLKAIVDQYMDVMKESMEETLGQIEVELDGRFSSLRTKETNLGNFVTDIMHNVSKVDVVLLNSGTLRSDALHAPGIFKKKDLVAILPMPDAMVVLELTGEQLLRALENGVSQWPKHEGRFPQVSGMKFAFNPDCEPGHRIVENSVVIGDSPLELKKLYTLCTKSYIAKGKDGYDVFLECKVVVDEEDGQIISTVVQNHFESINILKGVKLSKSKHRQSIVMKHTGDSRASILDAEKHHVMIDPKVEGRIINVKEMPQVIEDTNGNQETRDSSSDGAIDDSEEVTRVIPGKVIRNEETVESNGVMENGEIDQTSTVQTKETKPDLATEDEYWDLWEAVKVDDVNTVKRLRDGKNIRLTRLQDNKTILHLAAERNSSKVIEYLLTEGRLNVNTLDEILQGVPLHGAAEYDSIDAARILLDHGAEINKQDLIGNTALHIACMNSKTKIKDYLLSRGADTSLKNSDGDFPSL
ncbi:5'-nucleotidase isoform X2 [Exaiptasia diaphana]|uniref:5'-nucleotidase n=1 Tax=Exaiptasia diaphana TaxID=2652724 RepID=A0A913X261_EXADI|nr:5'-nucleotidase isoform X2 [Exaiptasia diaphana]